MYKRVYIFTMIYIKVYILNHIKYFVLIDFHFSFPYMLICTETKNKILKKI